MKIFKDLKFKPRDLDLQMEKYNGFKLKGIKSGQARLDFDNGYGISVIRGYGTYGYEKGLYEIAVFKDGRLCYDTPITDDVIGYQTPKQITEIMKQIQLLPNNTIQNE